MKSIAFIALTALTGVASANLISNGGFENVPPPQHDQGILPNDWYQVGLKVVGADTYDTTPNLAQVYGLQPGDYGHFTGLSAHGGNRWVAGWSAAGESFGQTFASPLQTGRVYDVSGWLHVSIDHQSTGGYKVYGLIGSNYVHIGDLFTNEGNYYETSGQITPWQHASFSFSGDNYSAILFDPFSTSLNGGDVYTGLDDVSLDQVRGPSTPGPAAVIPFAIGALASLRRRLKRS